MTRRLNIRALIVVVGLAGCGFASGQDQAPGKTGGSQPVAVIEARQALMSEMQVLIEPIDLFAYGDRQDATQLTSAAGTIAQMLKAFPHLFPPTTNLYDPQSDSPVTIAMPAVWENFPAFYSLSMAASSTADRLSLASSEEELTAGASALRGACDACHAQFMLPYSPPAATSEDSDFDFDALFEELEVQ